MEARQDVGDRAIVDDPRRAVLADLGELAVELARGEDGVPQLPDQSFLIRGRHVLDSHPQELLAGVAQQGADGGVGVDEPALVVEEPDGVQGVLEEGTHAATALLERFLGPPAVGDVEGDPPHGLDPADGVTQGELDRVQLAPTAGRTHLLVQLERRPGLDDRPILLQEPPRLFGREQAPRRSADHVVASHPEQALPGPVDEPGFPVGGGDVDQGRGVVQQPRQELPGLAQRRLVPPPRGDIPRDADQTGDESPVVPVRPLGDEVSARDPRRRRDLLVRPGRALGDDGAVVHHEPLGRLGLEQLRVILPDDLVPRPAEQAGARGVDHPIAAVPALDEDSVVHDLDDGHQRGDVGAQGVVLGPQGTQLLGAFIRPPLRSRPAPMMRSWTGPPAERARTPI